MLKNPFVNSKSRKRRKIKIPISKPKVKLFCPRTMVRYEGTISEYETIWVCKMCLINLLSPEAVKEHLTICNAVSNKAKFTPIKKNEDISYICESCNKVFSRRVTLKKHLEVHKNSSISVRSEQSDNEDEADSSITENENKNNDKSEEENSWNSTDSI